MNTNMLKEIAASSLCLILLAGCDDADVKSTSVVDEVQQTQQKNNETAIYLPGGAGIDFSRLPVSDENIVFNNSNLRKVVYEFSEGYKELDKSVSSILEAEKYYRHVNVSKGSEPVLAVSFQKAGSEVIFVRYFVQAKGTADQKTTLIMTWPI